jgi:predicted GNAT superfamily acetyltransferase
MGNMTLHLVKNVEGCEHFRALQLRVWGSEPDDMVPNHVTVTVLKNGGALLGAYAEDGPSETGGMVGAAFWWIGLDEAQLPAHRLKICSHMVGVLPAWQGRGVGLLLKVRQRELILQQGLTDWVTWTYDPLQRVNGVLNIHRLGATCRTYLRNVYGEMRDALNAGAPSDRFQVDWWLRSRRVQAAIAQTPAEAPASLFAKNATVQRLPTAPCGAFLQPVEQELPLNGAPLAVPIPADINQLRRQDRALGLAWRYYSRIVFERAFHAGYQVVDCRLLGEHGWHYVLEIGE